MESKIFGVPPQKKLGGEGCQQSEKSPPTQYIMFFTPPLYTAEQTI